MGLRKIGEALVAGCREGRERDNLASLYAPDAVSVEAGDTGTHREAVGLEAIRAKHDWWRHAMEVLKIEVRGPLLHAPDRFAVIFCVTARDRASDAISRIEEVGVYTVVEGRITREEFFY